MNPGAENFSFIEEKKETFLPIRVVVWCDETRLTFWACAPNGLRAGPPLLLRVTTCSQVTLLFPIFNPPSPQPAEILLCPS